MCFLAGLFSRTTDHAELGGDNSHGCTAKKAAAINKGHFGAATRGGAPYACFLMQTRSNPSLRGSSPFSYLRPTFQSLLGVRGKSVAGSCSAHPMKQPPKSRRSVRLTRAATEPLRSHLKRQVEEMERMGSLYQAGGLVFATQTGTLINPSNLRNRSFKPLLKRAGL